MPHRFNVGDVKAWDHCQRRVWYDHNPPQGLTVQEDPFDQLILKLGEEHEIGIRDRLGNAVEARDEAHTRELIDAGTPTIYQPAFTDEEIGATGRPDFLVRMEDGTYQVADAKLAHSLERHPEIRIQIALYRALAGSSADALVYLGNGEIATVGDEETARRDKFIASIQDILSQDAVPGVGFSESKCSGCPYDAVCRPVFVENGELTLVYGVDSRSVPGLIEQGIATIGDLAAADAGALEDVPYLKGPAKERAILQAKSQLEGTATVLAEPQLPAGTWIHFDVEDYPLTKNFADGNEVYLWGLLKAPFDESGFVYVWSDGGPEEDERAWREFVEMVKGLRADASDLVLAHYSSHEKTKIKQYAARYDMADDPTVGWLLGKESPLCDLQPIVRNAVALPLTGYGLKAICKHEALVNFQWELEESGSQWSVVRYHDFLNASDEAEREAIATEIRIYNRDDVRAMHALEQWLQALTS